MASSTPLKKRRFNHSFDHNDSISDISGLHLEEDDEPVFKKQNTGRILKIIKILEAIFTAQ